eukprot:6559388-Heterocapsa_arctica.AAC.1
MGTATSDDWETTRSWRNAGHHLDSFRPPIDTALPQALDAASTAVRDRSWREEERAELLRHRHRRAAPYD